MAIRAAQEIINEFCIRDPSEITLEEIAVVRGVYPREIKLEGCDARLTLNQASNMGIASINSDIPEPGRKRFALAHEIGHFELHRKKKRNWDCTESDFLKWYRNNEEEPEVNSFAAELLMPDDLFTNSCSKARPGFEIIKELASLFSTSLTSAAIRYVEKGNYPCAVISIQKGKIRWYRASGDFNYKIVEPGSKALPDSIAGDYFICKRSISDKPEQVPDYCWLEMTGPSNRIRLYEHAIAMPNYNTVLSLVWVR